MLAVLATVLGACGNAKLDRQQQEATSRECISLLDRHAARGNLTAPFLLGGDTYDLGRDASSFYSKLGETRGPDAFPVDASGESDTGRQDVVRRKCSASDVSKSSSRSGTTSTTAPASTPDG